MYVPQEPERVHCQISPSVSSPFVCGKEGRYLFFCRFYQYTIFFQLMQEKISIFDCTNISAERKQFIQNIAMIFVQLHFKSGLTFVSPYVIIIMVT